MKTTQMTNKESRITSTLILALSILSLSACQDYQVINPRYFLIDQRPLSAQDLADSPELCARMNLKNLVQEETREFGTHESVSTSPTDIRIDWKYITYGTSAPDFEDSSQSEMIKYDEALSVDLYVTGTSQPTDRFEFTWTTKEYESYTTALSEGEGRCGYEYFYEIKHCSVGSSAEDLEKKAPGTRKNSQNQYAASACD
jgi:hypothetical protein